MGCSANYHLRRAKYHLDKAKAKDSTAVLRDTVPVVVEIPVPEVRIDTTIVSKPGDTVVIVKDKLSIRYVKLPGDTTWIEGECKADTIIKEIKVPVEVSVIRETYKDIVKRVLGINNLVFYIIHIGALLVILYVLFRKVVG